MNYIEYENIINDYASRADSAGVAADECVSDYPELRRRNVYLDIRCAMKKHRYGERWLKRGTENYR